MSREGLSKQLRLLTSDMRAHLLGAVVIDPLLSVPVYAVRTSGSRREQSERMLHVLVLLYIWTRLLPLQSVAPAAAGCQVGCEAEVTGGVLETGCRNQTHSSTVRQAHTRAVTQTAARTALTGQRRELERRAADDLCGVDLDAVVFIDRTSRCVFNTKVMIGFKYVCVSAVAVLFYSKSF